MEAPPPPPASPQPPPKRRWSDRIFLVGAIALLVVIVAGLSWAFLGNGQEGAGPAIPTASEPGAPSPVTPGPTSGGGGECGDVKVVPPTGSLANDRTHADAPLSSYASIPPASGPHDPSPLPPGSYEDPPPIGRVIHSLEHGAVAVWYAPSLAGSPEIREIVDFLGPSGPAGGEHVIAALFDYPDEGEAGQLPANTTMALVAWHRLRLCPQPSLDAVAAFIDAYRCGPSTCDPNSYRGEAPEPGVQM